ncbi:MAG: ArsI/CadI family heavy metal resistance metalloenzyme [Ilumatobacteraceae bacterium]
MSRLQLALNVRDLAKAIDHYSRVFGVAPAKVRPGYANFVVAEPPLKLVLMEDASAIDSVNHLGIEVESVDEVRAAHDRVTAAGLPTVVEGETTCCFAVQDKFWIEGGEQPFEVYTVLADADVRSAGAEQEACCTPTSESVVSFRTTPPA